MRLCTKCNRLLKSSEPYCPYCAGEKTDPPAAVGEAAPRSEFKKTPAAERPTAPQVTASVAGDTDAQAITMEIPLTGEDRPLDRPDPGQAVPAPGDVARPAQAPEEDLDPQGLSMEIAFGHNGGDGAVELLSDHDEPVGFIERELDDLEDEDAGDDKPHALGKLGVALIVILVLAAVFFAVNIYRKLQAPSGGVTADVIAEYVEGSWLSDEFTYTEVEDPNHYVEYLVINGDGTFSLQILVPNNAFPEGYLTDNWQVAEHHTGTYTIDGDANILLLEFELDDQAMTIRRHIVDIGQNNLTLREYYDENRTDYYDVEFARAA